MAPVIRWSSWRWWFVSPWKIWELAEDCRPRYSCKLKYGFFPSWSSVQSKQAPSYPSTADQTSPNLLSSVSAEVSLSWSPWERGCPEVLRSRIQVRQFLLSSLFKECRSKNNNNMELSLTYCLIYHLYFHCWYLSIPNSFFCNVVLQETKNLGFCLGSELFNWTV